MIRGYLRLRHSSPLANFENVRVFMDFYLKNKFPSCVGAKISHFGKDNGNKYNFTTVIRGHFTCFI